MGLYKSYKTSSKKELEGVKIECDPNEDGSIPTFVIARASRSNVKYAKCLEAETKPHRRKIELDALDPMLSAALMRRVFIKTLLLGWSNVKDEKGNEIAFNESNAEKLLVDLPDLYDELHAASNKISLFRDEALESDAKN